MADQNKGARKRVIQKLIGRADGKGAATARTPIGGAPAAARTPIGAVGPRLAVQEVIGRAACGNRGHNRVVFPDAPASGTIQGKGNGKTTYIFGIGKGVPVLDHGNNMIVALIQGQNRITLPVPVDPYDPARVDVNPETARTHGGTMMTSTSATTTNFRGAVTGGFMFSLLPVPAMCSAVCMAIAVGRVEHSTFVDSRAYRPLDCF
jgi:hypothetical protein